MKRVVVTVLVIVCGPMSVDAAVLKMTTFGCKAEADATKAIGFQVRKDSAGLDKFTAPKVAAGECVAFGRGVSINAETKKPPLVCVRLSGDLNCYWVADSLVDLNPPQTDAPKPGRGGGRRR